jgi:hypothetical protein
MEEPRGKMALHPENRRRIAAQRLRAKLDAQRAGKTTTLPITVPAETRETRPAAEPAAPASMEELEKRLQDVGGDVDALVRQLQLPSEVAAAAREYAAADADTRTRTLDSYVEKLVADAVMH